MEWWRSLRDAPAPLTARQRSIVVAASILAALSRLLAISRTPWDWDEMLFMLALRHYDVAAHHPHPPGFPLFIATAKLIHALGLSEFRSLQLIAIVSGMLIVPVTFALCRELRLPFVTCISAAMLLAFSPNVWFFGGTAFSDVPSMVLVIAAIALLLRGCRDRRAYYAGAVVLAIATGYRPQNLLIGCAPALLASAYRRWSDVVAAAVLGAAIVAATYGTAAALTGIPEYREALAAHQDYITSVDSFRNPARPPLWKMFDWFFVRPYRALPINIAMLIAITVSFVASLVKRRPPLLLAMAAFGPFCIFAWLILDRFSTSRFSIGYLPLLAILAADGIRILARRAAIESALAALVVAMMIVWTWPALTIVRTTASPPVAAARWLRAHASREPIYVHGSMAPFADALLAGCDLVDVANKPAVWRAHRGGVFVREEIGRVAGAINFTRERGNLWAVARQRYFDVSVAPLQHVKFGNGWFAEESEEHSAWRWMGAHAVALLPPPSTDHAHLILALYVPQTPAHVTIRVNGNVVAEMAATTPQVTIDQTVTARDGWNELVIDTDRTVQPKGDPRRLGVRLNDLQWE